MIMWVKFPNFLTILFNSFKKYEIWIWIFWNSDISNEGLEVGSGFPDSHVHSIRCVVQSLCEKCSYSELCWSTSSWIWTEYGEISIICPIQSECDKMPTRITLNTDTFYVVNAIIIKVNQNGKSGNSPNILRDFLKERKQRAVSSQRAIFFIEK